MHSRPLNPTDIHAPSADYRHGIEITNPSRIVYTAGTIGLEIDGVAGLGIDCQLELSWSNIKAILATADVTTDNIVRLTTHLSDRAHAEKNTQARMQALNGRVVPTTAIIRDPCDPSWLVEVEMIAAA